MSVSIRIDRLVLDGLAIEPHEAEAVSRALRTELRRLVREHGLTLSDGFAVPHLHLGSVDIDRRPAAAALGRRLAGAIYTGVRPPSDVGTADHRGQKGMSA